MYTDPYGGAATGLRGERAYGELKHRLLIGDFPLNVRLGEERLAALVGVSRTPVREALHRLHAEGLVRRAADGGFEPVAPAVDDIRQLYEVRIGLELMALERPMRTGERHDERVLSDLHEDWSALRADAAHEATPSFVLLDESFHVTLAEAAGNPTLADLLRQVNERIRIVRMQDFLTAERVEQTIDEHLGILDAVHDADAGAAVARLLAHVETSVAVVEARVNRAIARMITGGTP